MNIKTALRIEEMRGEIIDLFFHGTTDQAYWARRATFSLNMIPYMSCCEAENDRFILAEQHLDAARRGKPCIELIVKARIQALIDQGIV